MKLDWPGRREMCWVICCVFKLMWFQSLCGRKNGFHPLGMTVSLGVDAESHGEIHWARMSKLTPLSLSFPSVLQLTSSALLYFFSLSAPIILWVLCPFSLVFSTPHFFLGWGGSWTLFILLKLSFPQRMCQTRTLMHIHTCKCTLSYRKLNFCHAHTDHEANKKRSAEADSFIRPEFKKVTKSHYRSKEHLLTYLKKLIPLFSKDALN